MTLFQNEFKKIITVLLQFRIKKIKLLTICGARNRNKIEFSIVKAHCGKDRSLF